ncbi:MAG: hypothetical protein AAFR24_00305 [Cyanobacteria bacterium J06627_3]
MELLYLKNKVAGPNDLTTWQQMFCTGNTIHYGCLETTEHFKKTLL